MAEREITVTLLQPPPPGPDREYQLLMVISLPFSESPTPSNLQEAIIDEVRRFMPGFSTSTIQANIYKVRLTSLRIDYLLHPAFPTAKIRSTDRRRGHQSGLSPEKNGGPKPKVKGGGDIGHYNR